MTHLNAFAITTLGILAYVAQGVQLYTKPCPLVDANYPAPSHLGTNNRVASAADSTDSQILNAINSSTTYGQFASNLTAFSVQVYSIHDDSPLYTYHYTPKLLVSQRTAGVETVDSDTIYRLGSVSKLWTVYIYLIAEGDKSWNDPITNYVPELAAIAKKNGNVAGDVDQVDWASITVGALASQMAGIARDSAYSGELSALLEKYGIPNSGGDAHSTCGDASRSMLPCNRTAFFEDFPTQHPVFSPFDSPVYSNAAYQILSYALENITGKSMPDLFHQHLVQPLNLTSTYYTVPPANATASGIIPVNTTVSWWNADTLDETPAGGYYSSINDVRKVGTAILRSLQLTPAQTRRWMKPHSFLANPDTAVGAPWEIVRAPGEPVTWMYTKSGDIGAYASEVVLLPDFDVGFSVLAAGSDPGNTVRILSDILSETWVPVLRNASKDKASAVYTGTYADKSANSRMTVSTTTRDPGLVVTEWKYGGLDVISLLSELFGLDTSEQKLSMHLYATGLSKETGNGTEVAWRAVYEAFPRVADPGPFSSNCISWVSVDAYTYGGVGFDEFLFTVDEKTNKAVALESRLLVQSLPTNATAGSRRLKKMVRSSSTLFS